MHKHMFTNKNKGGEEEMGIMQIIADYGVDTLVIAIGTVVFTGTLKIPIKKLAEKTKSSKKITRFITLLPIIIGLGITALSRYLLSKQIEIDKEFNVQWLSSVSLSLAIYAVWEKFVPSEKKILTEAELEANKAAVEELKSKLQDNFESIAEAPAEDAGLAEIEKATEHRKIILTNDKKLR